jgi:4-hydroxy-4-methyl-2-oxoglutarate aldolase
MRVEAWSRSPSYRRIAQLFNIPIVCAGTSISPGDVIVGDADGVVVVPRDSAKAVVAAVDERLAKEDRTGERLKAGALGLDIYRLRDVLAQRGVVWRD